jgi:acetyl-CoA carboxylase biotin carboxyl carrier protein
MSAGELPDNLKTLMEEFTRSGLRELHIRTGTIEVYLSSDSAATSPSRAAVSPQVQVSAAPVPQAKPKPKPVQAPATAKVADAALPVGAVIVRAPNLGTFYRSPKPGAAPYVEVGSKVAVGDEVCLIEVMKLFTAVGCEIAGTIHSVLVEDGAMVEADQPLFAVVEA